MSKNLVAFWGWAAGDRSHQSIQSSSPKNFNIVKIDYPSLMSKSDIRGFKHRVANHLQEMGIHSFSLLGHSLGGGLAIDFAAEYPDMVDHLYLLDTIGISGKKKLINTAIHIFERQPKHDAGPKMKLKDFLWRVIRTPIFHARLAHFAYNSNLEFEARNIKSPTTIFWGEEDQVIPVAFGQRLQTLIPDSELIIFPKLKHDWIKFYPELFWQNVR